MSYIGHTGFAILTTGESSDSTYFGYDQFKFPISSHPTKPQEKTIDVNQIQRSVDHHNTMTILLVLTVITCCLVGLHLWYNHNTMSFLLFLPLIVTVVTILFLLVVLPSRSFLPEVMMTPQTRFQLGALLYPLCLSSHYSGADQKLWVNCFSKVTILFMSEFQKS